MCGILGLAGPRAAERESEFGEALDLLTHRGPDDRGLFKASALLLGHRRLSILDLSAAGHQPMVDEATGAAITFNGEIYNYLELKQELEQLGHRFRSRSDTEVLLRAWLHWGEGCLQRLNGMWAFAIWLPAERRIVFARDRFGVKPFHYHHGRSFCFASEPKAILRLFPQCRSADSRTLCEFLAWGKLHASDASFYRGLKTLPPAHCGEYRIDDGTLGISRYWDYPPVIAHATDSARADEEFAALFDDAVRVRLRSDVPVGITLSGGLDSTAVLAASMKTSASPRPCFTAVYDDEARGEAPWARTAAAPYGIEPIEVEAPRSQWIELLARISWHMDAPGYSPAVFPLWNIMAQARRRNVPVLLEGQGADEALAGYPQYMALAMLAGLKHAASGFSPAPLREIGSLMRGATQTFTLRWTALWLIREAFPGLTGMHRARVGAGSTLRPEFRLPLRDPGDSHQVPRYADPVNERLWRDHSADILPGLLHYGDAVSMAHSIESRLPFMDYRLVEWLFSRGSAIKLGGGRTKSVLRRYLAAAGQAAIAQRPDKQGFPTPVETWLAADGGAVAREHLLANDSRIREFCDPARIRRLVDLHARGGSGAGNHLYRLLSTESWMRECLA